MTLVGSIPVYDPWGKALSFFVKGQLGAGMAVLALGLDAMADRGITSEVSDHLRACAVAAAAFAHEWSSLSPAARRKHAALLVSPAAWVPCPDCEEFLCTLHLMHACDCKCPPIEEWTVDPYTEGRHSHKEH